ncbi:TetR/AcrR family transcriptional regulator [Nonomuraea thailandensis]
MARSKEFDPEVALQQALELFWERGYEATSMADLVERLGLARASVYATFGGKRELYLKALELYLEQRNVVDSLSQPGPALPAVRALLDSYVAEILADELRRGCMVVNTAVEFASRDATVLAKVASSWAGLEAALAGTLVRARAQGRSRRARIRTRWPGSCSCCCRGSGCSAGPTRTLAGCATRSSRP